MIRALHERSGELSRFVPDLNPNATDLLLRFRRTGCRFMTRRSLWIGATPVDERCRYLLDGWHP